MTVGHVRVVVVPPGKPPDIVIVPVRYRPPTTMTSRDATRMPGELSRAIDTLERVGHVVIVDVRHVRAPVSRAPRSEPKDISEAAATVRAAYVRLDPLLTPFADRGTKRPSARRHDNLIDCP